MKNSILGIIFLSIFWLSSCNGAVKPAKETDISKSSPVQVQNTDKNLQDENNPVEMAPENGTVIQLTKAMFLEKIYNYEKNPKEWTFIGDKPCVIDFYADWCRPCKMVSPIMAELSEKYKGQIVIYKVNTDQERELAQFFGIRSIPTLFFCPSKGNPQMTQGALPKDDYEKIITEVLLHKNK